MIRIASSIIGAMVAPISLVGQYAEAETLTH